MSNEALITVITPTTGKDSLFNLIKSLKIQKIKHVHIMLWDDAREGRFLYPDSKTMKVLSPFDLEDDETEYRIPNNIIIKGMMVKGRAYGSSLRSIGLMIANTPYVTFADDDVWFEENHLSNMIQCIKNSEWCYCKRKIWAIERDCDLEYLGIDNFEGVGDSPERKVSYEMVDNSCMMFNRRFGTSAAVLYRETQNYNDDRLMYGFLKQYAGNPNKTDIASVNQICPDRLKNFFRQNCDK